MKQLLLITCTLILSPVVVIAENVAVKQLTDSYQTQGAETGNAKRGQALWNKTFTGKVPFTERSCKVCHTANLKNKGEHTRTGKILKPLAPSVNKQSLTDSRKIKKWLKRNCKWTLGRECSAQEKTDLLKFINQQ